MNISNIAAIESLLTLPSPIQTISLKELPTNSVVKRDDLIHPLISGNKWRKLKAVVEEAKQKKYKRWISFGGAFSNHLCAVSTIAQAMKISFKAYVRGESHFNQNPTIARMISQGSSIEYIPRHLFRDFVQNFRPESTDDFIIPEGGTHPNCIFGVQDMISELGAQLDIKSIDSIWVSCGTGGTLAGILSVVPAHIKVYGVSAVNDPSIADRINKLVPKAINKNYEITYPGKRFGYGRLNKEMLLFMQEVFEKTGFRLDPIYTNKLFWEIKTRVELGLLSRNESILIIHTGGLQGIEGYEYIHQNKIYSGLT